MAIARRAALHAVPLSDWRRDDDLAERRAASPDSRGSFCCRRRIAPTIGRPIGINYPISIRCQPTGVRRRPGRDRLRRRAVPASPATPACTCTRLDDRRACAFVAQGRRDRPGARAGPGRGDAHRHAEYSSHADASGTLSRRRRAGSADDNALSCARAKRNVALASESRQVLPGQTVERCRRQSR